MRITLPIAAASVAPPARAIACSTVAFGQALRTEPGARTSPSTWTKLPASRVTAIVTCGSR
jgi:hypothetical protein